METELFRYWKPIQYKYKELCRRVLMVIYNENGMIRSLIRIIPDKDPWRIILRPLDDNKEPFDPCNIDEMHNESRNF